MMRRKDREITETEEILKIIDTCKVCRIAMQDKDEIYIVPMNFGYIYEDDRLVLFFHSAAEGRKIEVLKRQKKVGFEMDCEHRLITAESACGYGYSFASIIGNGQVEFIEQTDDKIRALKELMKHQTGQDFEFDHKMIQSVTAFKIVSTTFSGKRHE